MLEILSTGARGTVILKHPKGQEPFIAYNSTSTKDAQVSLSAYKAALMIDEKTALERYLSAQREDGFGFSIGRSLY